MLKSLTDRAKAKLDLVRSSSTKRRAFGGVGILNVTDNLFTLDPSSNFRRAEEGLNEHHLDDYIIIDVNTLRKRNCPEDVFAVSKVEFVDSGTLDSVISICRSIRAWLKEDSEKNVVVICCQRAELLCTIVSCALCFIEQFETAEEALEHYNSVSRAGWLGGFGTKKVSAAQTRFLRDFASSLKDNEMFDVPCLYLKGVTIRNLVSFSEKGCRLMITVVQNHKFIYSTMLQGGGMKWIKTSSENPVDFTIPLNLKMEGEASIKAYHIPERMRVHTPRILIFDITFHTGVIGEKDTVIYEKHEIDASANDTKNLYNENFAVELEFSEYNEKEINVSDSEDETETKTKLPSSNKSETEMFEDEQKQSVGTVCSRCQHLVPEQDRDESSQTSSSSQVGSNSVAGAGGESQFSKLHHHHHHRIHSPDQCPFVCPYASGSRSAPSVTHIFHHHEHQHRIEISESKEPSTNPNPTSSTDAINSSSLHSGSDVEEDDEDDEDLSRPTPLGAHEIEQLSEDEALALALQLSQAESVLGHVEQDDETNQPEPAIATPEVAGSGDEHQDEQHQDEQHQEPTAGVEITVAEAQQPVEERPQQEDEEQNEEEEDQAQNDENQVQQEDEDGDNDENESGQSQQAANDELFARMLQAQLDHEARGAHRISVSSLRRAQNRLPEHLDPDDSSYENLLQLQEFIGFGRRRRAGASSSQIRSLPAFRVKPSSKYITEKSECLICRQPFQPKEILRTLPCIHAYHKECVDHWLRINKKCPQCYVRIDDPGFGP